MDTHSIRYLLAAALGVSISLASASPSTLYVTDLDRSVTDTGANPYGVSVVQVQGTNLTVVDSWRHGALLNNEVRDIFVRGPLAVSDGRISVLGPSNHGYNIDGSAQTSSICLGDNFCQFGGTANDGATDGTYNYTVSRDSGGGMSVWRTDRTWGNGSALFMLSGILTDESAFGITYDPFNQSLWVQVGPTSGPGDFRVLELSLTGTLKSEINSSNAATTYLFPTLAAGALAMDYADQSLWWLQYGDLQNTSSTVYAAVRFDRQGQQLSYYSQEPCTGSNSSTCWPFRPVYGAEFEFSSPTSVPEPSTLVLLAAAAVALRLRRVHRC